MKTGGIKTGDMVFVIGADNSATIEVVQRAYAIDYRIGGKRVTDVHQVIARLVCGDCLVDVSLNDYMDSGEDAKTLMAEREGIAAFGEITVTIMIATHYQPFYRISKTEVLNV